MYTVLSSVRCWQISCFRSTEIGIYSKESSTCHVFERADAADGSLSISLTNKRFTCRSHHKIDPQMEMDICIYTPLAHDGWLACKKKIWVNICHQTQVSRERDTLGAFGSRAAQMWPSQKYGGVGLYVRAAGSRARNPAPRAYIRDQPTSSRSVSIPAGPPVLYELSCSGEAAHTVRRWTRERNRATARAAGNNASSRRRRRVGGARGRHRPPESSRIVWWHVHDPVAVHPCEVDNFWDRLARARSRGPPGSVGRLPWPAMVVVDRARSSAGLACGRPLLSRGPCKALASSAFSN